MCCCCAGGMAAETAKKNEASGIGALAPGQGLCALQAALAAAAIPLTPIPSLTAASPFDWKALVGQVCALYYFVQMLDMPSEGAGGTGACWSFHKQSAGLMDCGCHLPIFYNNEMLVRGICLDTSLSALAFVKVALHLSWGVREEVGRHWLKEILRLGEMPLPQVRWFHLLYISCTSVCSLSRCCWCQRNV